MIRILLAILLLSLFSCTNDKSKNSKPNIIVILADDLGYGETGIYGQQIIKTPNIDALAVSGMRFTQHYSGAPVCAPARYMLMTGKHAGHAYIRGNDEWRQRGKVWDYMEMFHNPKLEGQRPIPSETITLGNKLQEAGYITSIIGKWGLGAPETEGVPNKQGFDYFYGYNCQRQAHNLYASHMWENDQKVLLDNEIVVPHTKLDSLADPYQELSYQRFTQKEYAPAMMQEKALEFISNNQDKPFFLYYASPLPHLPLQAPKEYVDHYREILGEEEPYIGNKGYFPARYPRATYAAMISYLDDQVGELIAHLKELGLYENTLIIFTSDNGPTYTGGVDFEYFDSSAPLTNGSGRTKGHVYEGGVRVPMIASWPGHIEAGSNSDHQSIFYDYMPTLCEVAGVETPAEIDGISFLNSLMGEEQEKHDFLYWEFPSYKGQQAVRMGKWKGIRKNIFEGNMEIELYDLEDDLEEQNNIAGEHPEIVEKLKAIMAQEHERAENERFQIKELGD